MQPRAGNSLPGAGAPPGFGPHWLVRQRLGGPGDVFTFYSYKGGTGRSMSLVNCAGLIAQQLQQLRDTTTASAEAVPRWPLLIDFDLEAPGLHRYLAPLMAPQAEPGPGGVLELFEALSQHVDDALARQGVTTLDDETTAVIVESFDIEPYKRTAEFPGSSSNGRPASLQLIMAGRFDDDYDARLQRFDWPGLHARAPALFRAFGAKVAAEHSFVFVDSRTGLSDTSGICTMLLPDVLVVVFTPNNQSLTGIEHLVRKAVEYRAASPDLRPLRIYPLPSRVDNQVEHFRRVWRLGETAHPLFGDVAGYQPLFTTLLTPRAPGTMDLGSRLGEYFDAVQVPHAADYAFGERLCFTQQGSSDSLSIRGAYELLLPWLVTGAQPWQRPADELNDLRAALWLRDAGVAETPASDDGWGPWFERVTRVVASPETADLATVPLMASARFDLRLAESLAHANVGDFAAARASVDFVAGALDNELAASLAPGAPSALLGLLRGESPPPEVQADAAGWLQALDSLMSRWQPLPRERRSWLQALVPLATEWGLTELRLRAATELDGEGSEAALRAQLAAAQARELAGDTAGALALVESIAGSLHPVARGVATAVSELLPRLREQAARSATRPLPSISDCDSMAWVSFSASDNAAWFDWVTHFTGELERSLRALLRGVRLPPLADGSRVSGAGAGAEVWEGVGRQISRSFAFILVVGDDGSDSSWCRRETAAFLDLYGPTAAERLHVVAMTQGAVQRVLAWPEWQKLGRGAVPIVTSFFSNEAPERPIDIFLAQGLVSPQFRAPFERVRDALRSSMRASLENTDAAAKSPLAAASVPLSSALLFPDRGVVADLPIQGVAAAVIYIESNRIERTHWEGIGDQLRQRWDRLHGVAGAAGTAPRLRVRGLPVDHLDSLSLADAAGILLLWGAKTPEALVAQVGRIEGKLPSGHGPVPGVIAYLSPPQQPSAEPLPAWGWRVLRVDASDVDRPVFSQDDAADLDRFLVAAMHRAQALAATREA